MLRLMIAMRTICQLKQVLTLITILYKKQEKGSIQSEGLYGTRLKSFMNVSRIVKAMLQLFSAFKSSSSVYKQSDLYQLYLKVHICCCHCLKCLG